MIQLDKEKAIWEPYQLPCYNKVVLGHTTKCNCKCIQFYIHVWTIIMALAVQIDTTNLSANWLGEDSVHLNKNHIILRFLFMECSTMRLKPLHNEPVSEANHDLHSLIHRGVCDAVCVLTNVANWASKAWYGHSKPHCIRTALNPILRYNKEFFKEDTVLMYFWNAGKKLIILTANRTRQITPTLSSADSFIDKCFFFHRDTERVFASARGGEW